MKHSRKISFCHSFWKWLKIGDIIPNSSFTLKLITIIHILCIGIRYIYNIIYYILYIMYNVQCVMYNV